jgi:hypothetical protein
LKQKIKKMLSDKEKKSFSLQESGYEVRQVASYVFVLSNISMTISQPDLQCAMAELFCQSITRYPSDRDTNVSFFIVYQIVI